jgi:Cerato-platanin
MIFPATFFIPTLFFTQIARALPQGCGDHIFPELSTPDLHNLHHDNAQYSIVYQGPIIYEATFSEAYDNPNTSTDTVACSNGANGLAAQFPLLGDIPSFPFIGGVFNVVWNSTNCGACWELTNIANNASIHITAVDTSSSFDLSEQAFIALNNGIIGNGVLNVTAGEISRSVCGL